MDNPVIGMSESQWYCNSCQRIHYGDEDCPSAKPKDCGHDDNMKIVAFVCIKCGYKECAECQYRVGGKCFQCGGDVRNDKKMEV